MKFNYTEDFPLVKLLIVYISVFTVFINYCALYNFFMDDYSLTKFVYLPKDLSTVVLIFLHSVLDSLQFLKFKNYVHFMLTFNNIISWNLEHYKLYRLCCLNILINLV